MGAQELRDQQRQHTVTAFVEVFLIAQLKSWMRKRVAHIQRDDAVLHHSLMEICHAGHHHEPRSTVLTRRLHGEEQGIADIGELPQKRGVLCINLILGILLLGITTPPGVGSELVSPGGLCDRNSRQHQAVMQKEKSRFLFPPTSIVHMTVIAIMRHVDEHQIRPIGDAFGLQTQEHLIQPIARDAQVHHLKTVEVRFEEC